MESNPFTSSEFIVFTTRHYAVARDLSLSAASHQLKTMEKKKWFQPVTRGIWANPSHPYFTPMACVPVLLGVEQGYVSFLTALHRHQAISQIPRSIQIATTGHSRRLKTSFSDFEFFQLKPEMMLHGVEWSNTHIPFRMATPEKALLDTLYMATRKGKRFASLPQLQEGFRKNKFRLLLEDQVQSVRIRAAIMTQLERYKLR